MSIIILEFSILFYSLESIYSLNINMDGAWVCSYI